MTETSPDQSLPTNQNSDQVSTNQTSQDSNPTNLPTQETPHSPKPLSKPLLLLSGILAITFGFLATYFGYQLLFKPTKLTPTSTNTPAAAPSTTTPTTIPSTPNPTPSAVDLTNIPQVENLQAWESSQVTHQVFSFEPDFLGTHSIPGTLYKQSYSRFEEPPEDSFNQSNLEEELKNLGWTHKLTVNDKKHDGLIADGPAGSEITYLAKNDQNQFRAITISNTNGCFGIDDDSTNCHYTIEVFISDIIDIE